MVNVSEASGFHNKGLKAQRDKTNISLLDVQPFYKTLQIIKARLLLVFFYLVKVLVYFGEMTVSLSSTHHWVKTSAVVTVSHDNTDVQDKPPCTCILILGENLEKHTHAHTCHANHVNGQQNSNPRPSFRKTRLLPTVPQYSPSFNL